MRGRVVGALFVVVASFGCSSSDANGDGTSEDSGAPSGGDSTVGDDANGADTPRGETTPTSDTHDAIADHPETCPTGPSTANVVVDTTAKGKTINPLVFGANLVGSEAVTTPGYATGMDNLGATLIRWPGGAIADHYHWKEHLTGGSYMCNDRDPQFVNADSNFDNFLATIGAMKVRPQINVTVNYGSNRTCSGGGDPAEAADWVDYANNVKKAGVKYWSIGNETYANVDFHDLDFGGDKSKDNDPLVYANAVKAYSAAMKAKDPSIQIGLVVNAGYVIPYPCHPEGCWNAVVLKEAKGSYDYVEYHWYGGGNRDVDLLEEDPSTKLDPYSASGRVIEKYEWAYAQLKSDMKSAGVDVPTFLGEWNINADGGGFKTTTGLGSALFNAKILGLLAAGTDMATIWMGVGFCGTTADPSNPDVYNVTPNLGSWGQVSNGLGACKDIPAGTPFPGARAFQLAEEAFHAGEQALSSHVDGLPKVFAYAATQDAGYAVLLVNVDASSSADVSVRVSGASASCYAGSTTTYSKSEYDAAATGKWNAPTTKDLGAVSSTVALTLPAFSVTVLHRR